VAAAPNAGDALTTVLTVGTGTLSSGNESGSTLTLSGTAAQINAALASVSYAGAPNGYGTDSLTVTTTDNVDGSTISKTAAITVNGLPVITVPGAQTIGVGQATAITGISVSESGNTSGETFTATLTDSNGVLTAIGGAQSDLGHTLTFTALSLTTLNNDLATLTDTNATVGSDTITLNASDSFGDAASQQAIDVMVNGLPAITVPGAQTLDVNQATAITGISVSESGNTGGETFTVTLIDTHGELSANTSLTGGGGTITGSGTHDLTITGSLSQVYSDLGTLSDTDATAGSDTITVKATDSFGNSASQQTIVVTAHAQTEGPEPPTLALAGTTATVSEEGTVVLPSITVTSADAEDVRDDVLTVTIAGLPMGATITDSADSAVFSGSSFTLSGAEVGSTLTLHDGNNDASFSLSVTGNNVTAGEAGSSAAKTIAVTVTPDPALAVGAGQSVVIDTASNQIVTFTSGTGELVLSDPGAFSGQIVGFTGTAPNAAHSDTIDLVNINYDSPGFTETYNSATGLLTVADGTHTASITFDNFKGTLDFASDGDGGTLITDPPAASWGNDAADKALFDWGMKFTDGKTDLDRAPAGQSRDGITSNTAPGPVAIQDGNDHFIFPKDHGAQTNGDVGLNQIVEQLRNHHDTETMQQLTSSVTPEAHHESFIDAAHSDSLVHTMNHAQWHQLVAGNFHLH
jgi:hypothetical protein